MTRFHPLDVVHVDLDEGLEALRRLATTNGRDVYAVFWGAGIPLGHAELARTQLDRPATLAQLVAGCIAPAVGDRLVTGFEGRPADLPPPARTATPSLTSLAGIDRPLEELRKRLTELQQPASRLRVSVVICSRDRPQLLDRCLRSLLETSVAPDEIVVVDNAPTNAAARVVVERLQGVIYVVEPRPGLSRARNAGLRVVTGDIVAFTDDDTVVHRDWIKWIRWGFEDPKIMSVTGLVLPDRLDTPSQVAFEKAMGGFSQGYRRIIYDGTFMDSTDDRGTPVWRVGAGANMAIRREAFEIVGEFDERLGAGAAGCSEDSEVWYRLLAAGWHCLYEPAAVVSHFHRDDFTALRRQARAYMRGHVAALFVQYARHSHRGNLHRAFVALPGSLGKRAIREFVLPRKRSGLFAAYVSGYLSGLRFLPLARPDVGAGVSRSTHPAVRLGPERASRRSFLRANPYPHPFSEGVFYREKMRAIHAVAQDEAFERILEVGGGQSGLSSLLYPKADVVNIDLEPGYASSRHNQRPTTSFVCGDATHLPFPANSFDAVTLFDVLEHVPNDRLAVSEVLRVLRPGGFVLISSPNRRWRFPYYKAMRSLCPTDDQIMAEWGHVRRGYSLPELEELMEGPADTTSSYISPLTAVGHDLAFSKLPGRLRTLACLAVAPVTWLGFWLHRSGRTGIETVSSWRPKDGR